MSEEERKFLEIVDLKKGFGSGETRQEVLRGMNFSVAKGEFCVLLGPSGSGKSTLLNIIGGIDSADSGYISINGDKLKDMSEKKLTQYRRKHLGYVFQMEDMEIKLKKMKGRKLYMYYVPDGTEQCGYYECKECGSRFLDLKIAPTLVCPYCGEEADMEIGPDEEMPKVVESAKLIQMVRGVEEVEKMDKLLSLAVTGGDFNWI